MVELPDGASPAHPVPGVVLCQGLSGVKHLVLPQIASRLAAEGLASIRFDYAGYGESDGERGWIDPRARSDDALSALAFLASHEAVDTSRIGVYGHSYGGPVAIAVAAQQARIRAVVSVSGPGDGAELLRSLRPSWEWVAFKRRVEEARTRLATTGEETLVDMADILPLSPQFTQAYEQLKASAGGSSAAAAGEGLGTTRFWLSSVDSMLDFHPQEVVRRLRACALMLIHGERDDVAPIETVYPVYANAPDPKRMVVFEGMGHSDLDAGSGLATAADLAARWLAQYLGH